MGGWEDIPLGLGLERCSGLWALTSDLRPCLEAAATAASPSFASWL